MVFRSQCNLEELFIAYDVIAVFSNDQRYHNGLQAPGTSHPMFSHDN